MKMCHPNHRTMDYEALPPAQRVMLFMSNGGFANLSAKGLALFDASIDWAVGDK